MAWFFTDGTEEQQVSYAARADARLLLAILWIAAVFRTAMANRIDDSQERVAGDRREDDSAAPQLGFVHLEEGESS